MLSTSLIERIVDEALTVLETQGVMVEDQPSFDRFRALGVQGDPATMRMRFPRALVRSALDSAPSGFSLFDRDGRLHARLEGDRTHYVPSSSALRIRDWRTNALREANTADLVEYIHVADQLENIAYLSTAFIPRDVPQDIADAWRMYAILAHSRQPFVSGAFTSWGVPRMGEIMQMFRSGRDDLVDKPMAVFTCCPNTPLRWGEDPIHNLIDCAEWGIPIEVVPVLLLGMISPATVVGSLVLHTAEVLSGVTLAQLVRPGTPVVFGGAPATFHMQYMTNPMTAAEAVQVFCGYAQIADHLGLPSQGYMGLSDSKFQDAQSGAESGIGMLLAHQYGMNSVSGPGMLEYVNCFSLEKLVFDDELIAYIERILAPVEVVDDLPTGPLLDELLEDNHLLTAEHTLEHWREQFLMPGPVWDRTNWEQWEMQGEQDEGARCRERVETLLDDHEPAPIDEALHTEITQLLSTTATDGPVELPEMPR